MRVVWFRGFTYYVRGKKNPKLWCERYFKACGINDALTHGPSARYAPAHTSMSSHRNIHLCKSGDKLKTRILINEEQGILVCATPNCFYFYTLSDQTLLYTLKIDSGPIATFSYMYDKQNIVYSTLSGYLGFVHPLQNFSFQEYHTNKVLFEIFCRSQKKFIIVYKYTTHLSKKPFLVGKGYMKGEKIHMTPLLETKFYTSSTISYSGQQDSLAFLDKREIVLCILSSSERRSFPIDNFPVCLKLHPIDQILAYGMMSGSIVLVDCTSMVAIKQFHWHSDWAFDIYFYSNGRYLYSAGQETVLVRWEIESGAKNFIPRLGSAISHIISSENHLVLLHENNQLTLVDPHNFYNTRRIIDHQVSTLSPPLFEYEPQTETLVLNGKIGEISFYSPSSSAFLQNIEIVQQNYLGMPQTRNNTTQYDVTHVRFSSNGLWMFTVEQTRLYCLARLKFWKIKSGCEFILSQSIENSHDSKINYVLYVNNEESFEYLITCGDDCTLKSWRCCSTESSKEFWGLSTMIMTHSPVTCCTASHDKLYIAVVIYGYVEVFELLTMQSIRKISFFGISQILFGYQNDSNKLLISSSSALLMYDIGQDKTIWTGIVKCSFIISDPISKNICCFIEKESTYSIQIYSWTDQILIQEVPLSISSPVIAAAIGNPHEHKSCKLSIKSFLFFMTENRNIYLLGDESLLLHRVNDSIICLQKSNDATFNSLQLETKNVKNTVDNLSAMKKFNEKLLTTPSHLLPSCEILNEHFLKAVLPAYVQKKSNTRTQDAKPYNSKIDRLNSNPTNKSIEKMDEEDIFQIKNISFKVFEQLFSK